MKTLKYFFMAMIAFSTAAAHAGREGGGGSRIETAFRLRAYEIIQRIEKQELANKMCSAERLRTSLDKTRIRLRSKLKDPKGNCSSQELLEACTYKHDMQLLEVKWATHLSPAATPEMREIVDALILHELYRATGTCNDDNYILTTKAFPLLKNDGAVVELKCPAGHDFSESNQVCVSRGQCPKGLYVSLQKPSMCADLKTDEIIGLQQCGIGYTLTERGCLPAGPCPEGMAFSPFDRACIKGIEAKGYYYLYNGQCFAPNGQVVASQYCAQGSPNVYPRQYPYANQYGGYYPYGQYGQYPYGQQYSYQYGGNPYQRQCYTQANGQTACY